MTAFSPLNELPTEHTSPELLYLETKWSSPVSYGMVAGMPGDVLPVDEKPGVATVCNHALGVETDGDPFTQTFYAAYAPRF